MATATEVTGTTTMHRPPHSRTGFPCFGTAYKLRGTSASTASATEGSRAADALPLPEFVHASCVCSVLQEKWGTKSVPPDAVNNVLFNLEAAFIRLTSEAKLFGNEPEPRMVPTGFEYLCASDVAASPCAECRRKISGDELMSRLIDKAAIVPEKFAADQISRFARAHGMYARKWAEQRVPLREHGMFGYFGNLSELETTGDAVIDHLEHGETRWQGILVMCYDES